MEGMGATLSMLYFVRGKALVANIGDSRVYRYRTRRLNRNTPGFAIWCIEAAISKKASLPIDGEGSALRPLERRQSVKFRLGDFHQSCEIKVSRAIVFKGCQGRMFSEDTGIVRPAKRFIKSHTPTDFRHLPPVSACLAGCRQKGALSRDPPFGVGHRAVFLPPSQ